MKKTNEQTTAVPEKYETNETENFADVDVNPITENTTAVTAISTTVYLEPVNNMDKKQMYNAMENSAPVKELIGKDFKIQGILNSEVTITDEETGETEIKQRLTLITDLGVYHSYSISIYNSLKRILAFFGNAVTDNTYTLTQFTKTIKGETRILYKIIIS